MTNAEIREACRLFIQKWQGKGKEDEDDRSYWIDILERILGVEKVTDKIEFQKKVIVDGNTKRIDAYIPETRVIIEQKSLGIALDKKGSQSGGIELTPYEQAKRYNDNLPYEEKARWIVTSNFKEIWVYDMNMRVPTPVKLLIENLKEQFNMLRFLVSKQETKISEEMELSLKAGELVAEIHDKLLKQYKDPNSVDTLHSLNKLCVRLVFCMYAEDAALFPGKNYFQKYTQKYVGGDYRKAIIEVFKILDIPESERDPYIEEDLNAFPYVNGGLFKDENIEIPRIDEDLRETIIRASDFDWSVISPTIFGAVFESTLNPETRRSGGMHYTSIENIHKVIDPLFLDDLNKEFEEIKAVSNASNKTKKLKDFQTKLSNLKFLDPACGSGNFLTETYVSLRRLENKILKELQNGQGVFGSEGFENPIKVSIGQFYGIEINDFAVTVAKTALWIAESQMMRETEDIVLTNLTFLPLKTNATVVEGNALRIDWETVVPKNELNYIMGNPPFVGYALQNKEQKEDILNIYVDEKGKPYKTAGKVDYVACWYFKTADFISKRLESRDKREKDCLNVSLTSPLSPLISKIKVAFVSTNSITQGEQVAAVWKPLYERFNVDIDFAYRTFRWDSEASSKAHVHCVIIGFSQKTISNEELEISNKEVKGKQKRLYDNGNISFVSQISPYLIESEPIFIESRKKPICEIPEVLKGSSPVDGGNLLLDDNEYNELLEAEPESKKFLKRFYGAKEFLHNIPRYCVWLENALPNEINRLTKIKSRIQTVKEFRLQSSKEATKKYAEYPTRFMECRQPKSNYILIPRHTSENRRYIPLGFMNYDDICGDANILMPNADIYHLGILTSNVHMSWVRTICGRIKSDFRYSNDIVYNNFPWPNPTLEQKAKIEQTAQAILDARALYPDSSLADLYDPLTMPKELKDAHNANDKAVMQAYGLSVKNTSESDCVAFLMKKYQELTNAV